MFPLDSVLIIMFITHRNNQERVRENVSDDSMYDLNFKKNLLNCRNE